MTIIDDVTYTVEIAWTGQQTGLFTIGSSLLGGTDVLGGVFGSSAYDDVTDEVYEFHIRRGRSDDLSPMRAGECSIILDDPTGKYNPYNTGGVLYGALIPMRPVRVRATHSATTYGLFYGFIRRIESDPAIGGKTATIECIDLFAWLDRSKPVIVSTGATTTGAAIGAILTAIGWTETAMRDLDTGDSISDFSADGTLSALALIQNLLLAERGVFYVDRDGQATYEDRGAIFRSPRTSAQSTITDVMSMLLPSVDLDRVKNTVTVERVGGTAQSHNDAASVGLFGYGDYGDVRSEYIPDDATSLNLAHWLVLRTRNPSGPMRAVMMKGGNLTLLTPIFARDLLDRMAIVNAGSGTSFDGHLENVDLTVKSGALVSASWGLSERWNVGTPGGTPVPIEAFTIGSSTLGSAHVFVY